MKAAVAAGLLVFGAPLAAQQVTLGAQFAFSDYREVSSGLHYSGTGGGAVATATYRRFSLAAAAVRLSLDPTEESTAGVGFTSTQIDAWVGYHVAPYASLEIGVIHRTADPELDAQSLGAIRVGARSAYPLGPGATVSLRANYFAVPTFSGGGHAAFSLDLGLGLDVRLVGRVRGLADYTFERVNRKTDPGGQGEIDAPIQQSVARVGLGVGF